MKKPKIVVVPPKIKPRPMQPAYNIATEDDEWIIGGETNYSVALQILFDNRSSLKNRVVPRKPNV